MTNISQDTFRNKRWNYYPYNRSSRATSDNTQQGIQSPSQSSPQGGNFEGPPHTWSVPLPIHHWASHIHPPWPFESSNSLCLQHISHICFALLIYHQISGTAPSSEVTAHFVPFVSIIGFIIILDNHLGFFPLSLDRKLYKYRNCTLFLVSAHCLAYSGHENSWRMIKNNIYWEFFICRALSLCTLQQLSHFILITRYFFFLLPFYKCANYNMEVLNALTSYMDSPC